MSPPFDLHRRTKLHRRWHCGRLSLEQHRQESVARRLQVIGKRLVELFGILVRLEEHHIEHNGPGPRLLEIPYDIPITIARPGPAPERLKAGFIDRQKEEIGVSLGRIRIAPDEMIQRFEFHHFKPSCPVHPRHEGKDRQAHGGCRQDFFVKGSGGHEDNGTIKGTLTMGLSYVRMNRRERGPQECHRLD